MAISKNLVKYLVKKLLFCYNITMQLKKIAVNQFDDIYGEMAQNFIASERRDYLLAQEILKRENYAIYHIIKNGEKVGFAAIWEFAEFIFVEHLVVYEQFRSSGLGAEFLGLIKTWQKVIVLECERATEPLATRRLNFYLRNGFCVNQIDYFQPPYRASDSLVPMELVSYPIAFTNPSKIVEIIYKGVYGI